MNFNSPSGVATGRTVGTALRRSLALAALLCLAGIAVAKPWWMRGVAAEDGDFLPPDVAFRVGARVDGNVVRLRWIIADGYYLYRRKFEIQAESPDLVVSAPTFPPGTLKADPNLGTQEIFEHTVEATVAYRRFDGGAHPLQIKVTYQGCAEAGLCYLPITKVLFPSAAAGDPAGAAVRGGGILPWVGIAIVGGGSAFFLAGLLLRKGRRLDLPAP